MKTDIPWRHYILCMAIYGVLVTMLEELVTLDPLLRGLTLIVTVSAYCLVARSRIRRS